MYTTHRLTTICSREGEGEVGRGRGVVNAACGRKREEEGETTVPYFPLFWVGRNPFTSGFVCSTSSCLF